MGWVWVSSKPAMNWAQVKNPPIGFLGISVNSEPVCSNCPQFSLFPLPWCKTILVGGHMCLWGRVGRSFTAYIFGSVAGFFLKETCLPLIQGALHLHLDWIKSGIQMRIQHCLLLGRRSEFLTLDLELFCVYKSSKTLIGCLFISVLGRCQ